MTKKSRRKNRKQSKKKKLIKVLVYRLVVSLNKDFQELNTAIFTGIKRLIDAAFMNTPLQLTCMTQFLAIFISLFKLLKSVFIMVIRKIGIYILGD